MSAKINFIKLTNQELSNKIALLVLNKMRIIFWKTSPQYNEGEAVSYRDNLLTLKTHYLGARLLGEQVCLNFCLNHMEYFIKGKVTSQIDETEELIISVYEECFRGEKRDFERIQVYPLHEVYVYLKYNDDKSNNIFFINKIDQKKNDIFSNIRDLEKQKLALLSSDLQTESGEDLIGFRVDDLSSNGLCFLANSKEKEQILDPLVNRTFDLLLSFGSKVFQLKKVKIVYQVNYINQQFAGVLMFKIGITFEENLDLKKRIIELTGVNDKLPDYQKEFEEFIKNE
jgi:hypothetical protein